MASNDWLHFNIDFSFINLIPKSYITISINHLKSFIKLIKIYCCSFSKSCNQKKVKLIDSAPKVLAITKKFLWYASIKNVRPVVFVASPVLMSFIVSMNLSVCKSFSKCFLSLIQVISPKLRKMLRILSSNRRLSSTK